MLFLGNSRSFKYMYARCSIIHAFEITSLHISPPGISHYKLLQHVLHNCTSSVERGFFDQSEEVGGGIPIPRGGTVSCPCGGHAFSISCLSGKETDMKVSGGHTTPKTTHSFKKSQKMSSIGLLASTEIFHVRRKIAKVCALDKLKLKC